MPTDVEISDSRNQKNRRKARRMNITLLPTKIVFDMGDMELFGGEEQAINLERMQCTEACKKIRVSNLTNISLLRRKAFQHRSMAELNLLLKR